MIEPVNTNNHYYSLLGLNLNNVERQNKLEASGYILFFQNAYGGQ